MLPAIAGEREREEQGGRRGDEREAEAGLASHPSQLRQPQGPPGAPPEGEGAAGEGAATGLEAAGEGGAAAIPAPNTEGRGSSEKSWGGGGERSRGGKKWAAVAHRAPPPTRAECAARKVDGDVGVLDVAHREDARPPTRAEVAAKKVDGAMEVMAVAHRVAPAPSPQGGAKKMDGAVGVLAVAQPEAPLPLRGEDAAKKKGGATGGKGADEPAASAFQRGAKPDNKGKGKVAAGMKQPSASAEAATVSSPGGTPEEKRKGKAKAKASGDQGTSSVPSSAPVETGETAGASSRGRSKPANWRNRKKGGVGHSALTTAPDETADRSPPCVLESQNKGKNKPLAARCAGAAPSNDSSDGKAPQPAPISSSPDGKCAQPAPISNQLDGKPSLAAELSSKRRSGGALGTDGETKPECAVVAKPPVVEAETTARAVRVVVRSARPPSIGGPRQQHGGVWVPKAVAPAPSRHSGSVRKNN